MFKNILKMFGLTLPILGSVAAADELMDRRQFQSYVFEYVKNTYKQYEFGRSADIEIITLGEIELGLQNLYNRYAQGNPTKKELNELLKDHFDQLLPQVIGAEEPKLVPWTEAKTMVRPQFAPIEYLDKANLAHQELDGSIVIAYVLDQEQGYRFIKTEDLEQWNVTLEDLSKTALFNLDQSSKKIPMQVSLENEKFIGVQAMDGYDAVRVLIPEFRQFVIEKLGEPFYAAIPNRDFLIMWSGENSPGFKDFAAEKVKKDFSEQPHPLTPSIFKVTKNEITVAQ